MKIGSLSKRVFDLVMAGLLFILLIPVFLLIILGFWLRGEDEIFFRQQRIGQNGRHFNIVKFRTLKAPGNARALHDRRFAWGDFLRRFSLDELPQLILVINGEMSLVGPRPLPVEYELLFSTEQLMRHQVKPGMTGLAQVNGRNAISWQKKFEYDVYYVRHFSLLLDAKILWKTVRLIFSFRKDVSLDEEKFKG